MAQVPDIVVELRGLDEWEKMVAALREIAAVIGDIERQVGLFNAASGDALDREAKWEALDLIAKAAQIARAALPDGGEQDV